MAQFWVQYTNHHAIIKTDHDQGPFHFPPLALCLLFLRAD